jgi:hypothetical protein
MTDIVLDPSEVAVDRVELALNTGAINVGPEGPDWGDAQIEQYLAEAARGQVPVDFRIPNRIITIPLLLGADGPDDFAAARRQLQAKVALFQHRGGWIKRGDGLYADIVNATLKLPDRRGHLGVESDVVLTLEAIPDFYGDEIGGTITDDFQGIVSDDDESVPLNQIVNPRAANNLTGLGGTNGALTRVTGQTGLDVGDTAANLAAPTLANASAAEVTFSSVTPPTEDLLTVGDTIRIRAKIYVPASSYESTGLAYYYLAVGFQDGEGNVPSGMYEWIVNTDGGVARDQWVEMSLLVTLGEGSFNEAAASTVYTVRYVAVGAWNNSGSARDMTFRASEAFAVKETGLPDALTPVEYFDGDSTGGRWTGTANASMSQLGSDPLTAWTFDDGEGEVTALYGQLAPSNPTAVKRFMYDGSDAYDAEVTLKHTTPSPLTTYEVGPAVRRITATDALIATVGPSALSIWKYEAGSMVNLEQVAITSLAAATSYWLRIRAEGDLITAEHWTTDPALGGSPATILTHTLDGSNKTKFGDGISGLCGVGYWASAHASARIDEVTISPNSYVERTAPELVRALHGIEGDYPGRVRIVVDEDQDVDQRGLLWAWRSRYHSDASTAAIAYAATALTPMDEAAVNGSLVEHLDLAASWTPVLSTNLAGGSYLTHQGTYRVWARVESADGDDVQVRFVWDVGDLALPAENAAVTIPAASGPFLLDLGEVRLDAAPVGTHRWLGQVQAKGTDGGEDIKIHRLTFQPLAENGGRLTAPLTVVDGLVGFSARDNFETTSGALTGDALPTGGNWTALASSDADDFSALGGAIVRAATADADLQTGRYVTAGTTAYSDIVARVGASFVNLPSTNEAIVGVFVRCVDISNWLAFVVHVTAAGVATLQLRKRVGGGTPTILEALELPDSAPNGAILQVAVNAAGQYACEYSVTEDDLTNFGSLRRLATGYDSALAAGGALDDGKIGIVHANTGAANGNVGMDAFAAWVPPPDAVVHAGETLECRTEGFYREDASGATYGPVSHIIGDLPRIPPSGLEERPVELLLKGTRGDFENLPDTGTDDISARVYYRASFLFPG